MALAILRGRKKPGHESGFDLERSANLQREKNTQVQEAFSFLPYSQEFWLYHSNSFHQSVPGQVHELWDRLVDGTVNTVKLPWAPEDMDVLGEQFMGWMKINRHGTLMKRVITRILSDKSYLQGTGLFDAHLFMHQLEHLLNLLPNEIAFSSLDVIPEYPTDALLQKAARRGFFMVIRLTLQVGADVNAQSDTFGNALHAAVSNNHHTIAELLITNGADVNLKGGMYGSALQAGAATLGMESIVEHLIKRGANVNARGGIYGTALIAAVATAHLPAMEILLRAGANVYSFGFHDENPLRMAAKRANIHIVKRLLEHEALVDKLDSEQSYMKVYDTTLEIGRLLYRAALESGPILYDSTTC